MTKCVNENCKNDPLESNNPILWGCDGDFACCIECCEKTRKHMDYFCGTILTNDNYFANWLGVPVELVRSTKYKEK